MQRPRLRKFLYISISIILILIIIIATVIIVDINANQKKEAVEQIVHIFIFQARSNTFSLENFVETSEIEECRQRIMTVSGTYTLRLLDASAGLYAFKVEFESGQIFTFQLFGGEKDNIWDLSCQKTKK